MRKDFTNKGWPGVVATGQSVSGAPSTITLDEYLACVRAAYGGDLPLNEQQMSAISHDFDSPLWMIAGPGTGKTHTLVWLALKRILVDGISPQRIILTTFTRKAAAELESRLVLSRQKLIEAHCQQANAFDIAQLQLGTLHALCGQLLQDRRYEPTLRIRVLEDELTQQFFVRRSHNRLTTCDDLGFWNRLGVSSHTSKYPPNTAQRTRAACAIFNRMTENAVDLEMMDATEDPHFQQLAHAYREYQEALREAHRTDQAHLQRHMLDYLGTPEGRTWLGDGFTVIVDEYQDTNPIQEELYFTFAGVRGDLTVVGDDDQSLYRFRGATVESLIDFDRACQIYLCKDPKVVYLHENRRSHPAIVGWVNRFISSHPEMHDARVRVRAPNKPLLVAASSITGDYQAVMTIVEGSAAAAAAKMVAVMQSLVSEKLVTDYSQIAVLAFSVKESTRGIGAYTEAMRQAAIPFYNPRNRTAHKDRRLRALLGALSVILDPEFDVESLPRPLPKGVHEYLEHAREAYTELAADGHYPDLVAYVDRSIQAVRAQRLKQDKAVNFLERAGGRRVTLNGLLFKLLGCEPFATDLTDAEGGERLKALNQVLAEWESLYDDGELRVEIDAAANVAHIKRTTLYNFYAVFVEGIQDGLNDPEDDETSIMPGMVNVMTIHQAKGLEFEAVFVLRPDSQPFLSETHVLEDLLDPFIRRLTKPGRRSSELRAAEDAIRLFLVAYSRAKRLLILTGSNLHRWDRVLGVDTNGNKLNTLSALESAGVRHI